MTGVTGRKGSPTNTYISCAEKCGSLRLGSRRGAEGTGFWRLRCRSTHVVHVNEPALVDMKIRIEFWFTPAVSKSLSYDKDTPLKSMKNDPVVAVQS